MSQLIVHPEADTETTEAFRWYRDSEPDEPLGDDFLAAVEAAIDKAAELGTRYLARYPGTPARYTKLVRFPYLVVFHETGERLLVVAVAHEKRRPAYWRGRLDD